MKNKPLFALSALLGCLAVGIATVFHTTPSITLVPVTIHATHNIPLVTVLIEGKRYHVDFDSGSQRQLRLRKELLHSIANKKPSDPSEFFDVKGNEYVEPSFLVPEVTLDSMTLTDVKVLELDESFLQNTHIVKKSNEPEASEGILGFDAFRNNNLLFDFAHSTLIICDDKKTLESQGYRLSSMIQAPFGQYKKCIFVTVETDMGPLKLIVDSGASLTAVRAALFQEQVCQKSVYDSPKYTTSTFALNGKNFGPQDLMLLEITGKMAECDGVLGMDFLLQHQLYIDRQNKTVYIG
jgi:hypothetical protein